MKHYQSWYQELRRAKVRQVKDPRANPVSLCALKIARQIEQNAVTTSDIDEAIDHLAETLLQKRVRAWRHGLSEHSTSLTRFVEEISYAHLASRAKKDADCGALSFEDFVGLWQRPRYGLVFTGHPTFALSEKERVHLALSIKQGRHKKKEGDQKGERTISIDQEHDEMMRVMHNVRKSLRALNHAIYSIASRHFPEQWHEILPTPMRVATWVGYDLDGRADITWQKSFSFRVQEKCFALTQIVETLHELEKAGAQLGTLQSDLNQEIKRLKQIEPMLQSTGDNLEEFGKLANALTDAPRYIHPWRLVEELVAYARANPRHAKDLMVLASEVKSFGFGVGEIHLRVNAAQVHNALRSHEEFSLDSFERRTALRSLSEKIEVLEAVDVNFASLMQEPSTVRRQMLVARQILKYIDGDLPVRFLIAECESPVTLLSALYLARLFGIEDKIDISPLFETAVALERGAVLVEKALANASWRTYIINRKRMCIQTGYSDGGRYIGQLAAALAIERLHIKIADVAAQYLPQEVSCVVFNTHGESMGRGCFPNDIKSRLNYVFSPQARRAFSRHGRLVHHETSFQGGDGFILFQNEHLAQRVIQQILTAELEHEGKTSHAMNDRLYKDTDFSLDFFLALKDWHQHLYRHPHYGDFLDAYGMNLLVSTGSRRVRRHKSGEHEASISRLRAIPHNALLQQMGYVANVCGGLGTAALLDLDRFREVYQSSERLQTLLLLVAHGLTNSSLHIAEAYADPIDSHYWMNRAMLEEGESAEVCKRIASHLLDDPRARSIRHITTMWQEDRLNLNSVLTHLRGHLSHPLLYLLQEEHTNDLELLSAIRIALVMATLSLTQKVPPFSETENYNTQDVLRAASSMDTDVLCALIRQAFPLSPSGYAVPHLKESASYLPYQASEYRQIEENITQRIAHFGAQFRRLGVVSSHAFGAFG